MSTVVWVYAHSSYPDLSCIINFDNLIYCFASAKVKVGVLRPVQQPGSYWDRSSELTLVGLEPTEVTAYD